MGIIPGRGATFAQPRFITMRGESSDGPSGNLADGHALSWIRDWRMGGVPEARGGAQGSPAWCSKGPIKSYPTHRERARAFIRTMHALLCLGGGSGRSPSSFSSGLTDVLYRQTTFRSVTLIGWPSRLIRGATAGRGSEGARERGSGYRG